MTEFLVYNDQKPQIGRATADNPVLQARIDAARRRTGRQDQTDANSASGTDVGPCNPIPCQAARAAAKGQRLD